MTLYSELQIVKKLIVNYEKIIKRKNKKIDRLRFIIKRINKDTEWKI